MVRLWDAGTGEHRDTLEGHTDLVNSVAFSPDGNNLASGSWDRRIRLWDAATGKLLQTLEGHTAYVSSVAFSPDGKHPRQRELGQNRCDCGIPPHGNTY